MIVVSRSGIIDKTIWTKPRGWHEICNWVKYPITLFHSKYGDRYPIVLTKIQEKSPNLRGKTVGRGGPKTTAERFRSCLVSVKLCHSDLISVITNIRHLFHQLFPWYPVWKTPATVVYHAWEPVVAIEALHVRVGGRMVSILRSYEHVPKGYRKAFIRMYGVEREKLPQPEGDIREKTSLL